MKAGTPLSLNATTVSMPAHLSKLLAKRTISVTIPSMKTVLITEAYLLGIHYRSFIILAIITNLNHKKKGDR